MHGRLLTVLATIGITAIINLSYIFKPLRDKLKGVLILDKFINCPQCVGLWVGALLFYLDNDLINYAGAGSLCAYTWFLLMKYFINKYD